MIELKFNDLSIYKDKFINNMIFSHIHFEKFLKEEICKQIDSEIDECLDNLNPYYVLNTKKYALNDMNKMGRQTKKLINYLNSKEFILNLERLTGIKNLISDPGLEGGGIHVTKKNGYLKIHSDFESHIINKTWKRKINLLIYFNKGFDDDYNGNIELYSKDLKNKVEYLPEFNSVVIFNTNKNSYHGHPNLFNPKNNEIRKSIALYYYVNQQEALPLKETNFQPLPNDSLVSRLVMKFDQFLLRIFSYLKRHKIINDKIITNFIKIFKR